MQTLRGYLNVLIDMPKSKIDKKIEIPEVVYKKLLTKSEMRMLKNRWQIVQLLDQRLSIREIAKKVGVGTDTVMRVAKLFKKDESKEIPSDSHLKNGKTAWVFGKTED